MLRCQCPYVCPSVRLSVTEVHWRIIANWAHSMSRVVSVVVVVVVVVDIDAQAACDSNDTW